MTVVAAGEFRMGKRKTPPVTAYAGERGDFVELRPTPPSGIEREEGPWQGQPTEATYPFGKRGRLSSYARPWVASVDPELEHVDWTAELVRERFREAMTILDRMPLAPTDRPSTRITGLLPVVHSVASAYGYNTTKAVAPPSTEEIQRMDEALTWLWWVPAEWRRAVVGIARGVPLRRVARLMRCSHEQVRRLERKGVERVARRLQQEAKAA